MSDAIETTVHTGTEQIPLDGCWELLRAATVARLAVATRDGVDIFPVNIRVDGRRIVFRTNNGAKLLDIAMNPAVAVEIDGWDDEIAWSVVARGQAESPNLKPEVQHLRGLDVTTWNPSPKPAYVEITPSAVEGRRFARVESHDPAR